MKPWMALLSLIACISLFVFGVPRKGASSPATAEDQVRKLEQSWLDAAAVPDNGALRTILSDDFMGTSFSGGVLSKTDIVPPAGVAANHMPQCTLRDSTVKIFGDTAVLMGEVEMQVPEKPEEIRMTTVFQKHSDAWQVIAVHMSKAPVE